MSELSLDKIDNLVGSVNSEIYIGYVKDEEEMNKNIIKTIDEEVGENDKSHKRSFQHFWKIMKA